MRKTITAAGIALAAGIAFGAWIAFREMSTVIVGTVKQYEATTRVAARATQARPGRAPSSPADWLGKLGGRDPIVDPQTESYAVRMEKAAVENARCMCGQRVDQGAERVPCPIHGPSYFDGPAIAAV